MNDKNKSGWGEKKALHGVSATVAGRAVVGYSGNNLSY